MYTDEQKQRIAEMVEAFKGCREYLRTDSAGICFALSSYALDRGTAAASRGATCAIQLIDRALGLEHVWLNTWVTHNNTHRLFSSAEMLALRHRWLDQLIADCQAALKD